MGVRFRKSAKMGPFRVTASKSGVSWSVGGSGYRYTKTASGSSRVTTSIPGSGLGYVTTVGSGRRRSSKGDAMDGIWGDDVVDESRGCVYYRTDSTSSGFSSMDASEKTPEELRKMPTAYLIDYLYAYRKRMKAKLENPLIPMDAEEIERTGDYLDILNAEEAHRVGKRNAFYLTILVCWFLIALCGAVFLYGGLDYGVGSRSLQAASS